ncbi:MAG: D-glycero-beta-D-manno-heptose 1,7-bisphosphate 7-phosphatase [Deltaproteobacteria bacterium]|nr:D-glycero-beta-D-manno-heptose 1,7-bisphosphate 7-phosphatase [Deltaproteobacteria bacterium]
MAGNEAPRKRAVFLDRDGTLNVEKNYLYRPEDFEFLPGVPEAIRRLREHGFLVVVVTNQSGVARGYFTLAEVDLLHRHVEKLLAFYGTAIDGFYVCPHHPDGISPYRVKCGCRKGEAGMLLKAAADFGIDLKRSFMVGDKAADLEAGEKAGCRPLLVLTGYGEQTAKQLPPGRVPVFRDLAAAVDFLLAPVSAAH